MLPQLYTVLQVNKETSFTYKLLTLHATIILLQMPRLRSQATMLQNHTSTKHSMSKYVIA